MLLEVDEQSSRFSLVTPKGVQADGYFDGEVFNISPQELAGIALELLKVASYSGMDMTEAVKSHLKDKTDADYYLNILMEMSNAK